MTPDAGAIAIEWQRSLVGRGSAIGRSQARLLKTAERNPQALARFVLRHMPAEDGETSPPLPRRLTADEFREPPVELEIDLAEAWDGLFSPRQAASTPFWLRAHAAWIADGLIDDPAAAFTLGGGGGSETGPRVRTLLRRAGGLGFVRGYVSVLSDCPPARAWWRARIAGEAERASGGAISARKAHEALQRYRGAGEALAGFSVMRLAAINHPRARAALIAVLAGLVARGASGTEAANAVGRMAGALARTALTRSPEYVPWEDLRAIAEHAADRAADRADRNSASATD